MNLKLNQFVLVCGAAAALLASGCAEQAGADSATRSPAGGSSALANPNAALLAAMTDRDQLAEGATLDASQAELLDLAFDAVSKMPLNPHVKNRSRAQSKIVEVCLQLDQPRRALAYIERIESTNWLHGAGYADLAYHLAQRGQTSRVSAFLAVATDVAESVEDWRRDRINAKIARTYELLGQQARAAELEAQTDPAEAGELVVARAAMSDSESFYDELNRLSELATSVHFDLRRIALEAHAELFDRAYDNAEQRSLAEQRLKSFWGEMPTFMRLELMFTLIESALDHDDEATALKLTDEATAMKVAATWQPEQGIAYAGRLAGLRFRAGDAVGANTEAAGALAQFDANRESIFNYKRGGVLRPIAEAYQQIGDVAMASELYARAVEDGAENPNARARALDLADTCCSMAINKFAPDERLIARLREIEEALKHPW